MGLVLCHALEGNGHLRVAFELVKGERPFQGLLQACADVSQFVSLKDISMLHAISLVDSRHDARVFMSAEIEVFRDLGLCVACACARM